MEHSSVLRYQRRATQNCQHGSTTSSVVKWTEITRTYILLFIPIHCFPLRLKQAAFHFNDLANVHGSDTTLTLLPRYTCES